MRSGVEGSARAGKVEKRYDLAEILERLQHAAQGKGHLKNDLLRPELFGFDGIKPGSGFALTRCHAREPSYRRTKPAMAGNLLRSKTLTSGNNETARKTSKLMNSIFGRSFSRQLELRKTEGVGET